MMCYSSDGDRTSSRNSESDGRWMGTSFPWPQDEAKEHERSSLRFDMRAETTRKQLSDESELRTERDNHNGAAGTACAGQVLCWGAL